MGDELFAIVIILTLAGLGMLFYLLPPIRAALKRKLEGGTAPDPRQEELLESLHARVLELEERVDFTERLLAQEREQARLPEPAAD